MCLAAGEGQNQELAMALCCQKIGSSGTTPITPTLCHPDPHVMKLTQCVGTWGPPASATNGCGGGEPPPIPSAPAPLCRV